MAPLRIKKRCEGWLYTAMVSGIFAICERRKLSVAGKIDPFVLVAMGVWGADQEWVVEVCDGDASDERAGDGASVVIRVRLGGDRGWSSGRVVQRCGSGSCQNKGENRRRDMGDVGVLCKSGGGGWSSGRVVQWRAKTYQRRPSVVRPCRA
jgi:hypothetical protein